MKKSNLEHYQQIVKEANSNSTMLEYYKAQVKKEQEWLS